MPRCDARADSRYFSRARGGGAAAAIGISAARDLQGTRKFLYPRPLRPSFSVCLAFLPVQLECDFVEGSCLNLIWIVPGEKESIVGE